MLYDPKWEKQTETKADPFSLASLIAWLEKRNPKQGYCYEKGGECLLHSYFTAMGFENVTMGGSYIVHGAPHTTIRLSQAFQQVAVRPPRTFGGALERARTWPKDAR